MFIFSFFNNKIKTQTGDVKKTLFSMFLNLVHQYTIQSIKDCSLHYLRIFQVNIQPFRKKEIIWYI